MAPMLFTDAILSGHPIKVFNHGNMRRDFTYIDDIVEGVLRVLDRAATALDSTAPYRVFNIGNNQPVQLMDFIGCIEKSLGKTAEKQMLPMQDGDVPVTFADTQALQDWVGFAPSTPLDVGIQRFAEWYCAYHKVSL